MFTRRTTTIDDRELILFITPNIVRDPSEVQAISVPDARGKFEDETAPFWRVKRKDWYKKLKKEIPAKTVEPKDMGAYISARQKLMDESVKELTAPPQIRDVGAPLVGARLTTDKSVQRADTRSAPTQPAMVSQPKPAPPPPPPLPKTKLVRVERG